MREAAPVCRATRHIACPLHERLKRALEHYLGRLDPEVHIPEELRRDFKAMVSKIEVAETLSSDAQREVAKTLWRIFMELEHDHGPHRRPD
jgi:hypothetical protein